MLIVLTPLWFWEEYMQPQIEAVPVVYANPYGRWYTITVLSK